MPLTLKAHTLLSGGAARRALRDTTAHLYHLTQRFDERLAHLGTVGLGALLVTTDERSLATLRKARHLEVQSSHATVNL